MKKASKLEYVRDLEEAGRHYHTLAIRGLINIRIKINRFGREIAQNGLMTKEQLGERIESGVKSYREIMDLYDKLKEELGIKEDFLLENIGELDSSHKELCYIHAYMKDGQGEGR